MQIKQIKIYRRRPNLICLQIFVAGQNKGFLTRFPQSQDSNVLWPEQRLNYRKTHRSLMPPLACIHGCQGERPWRGGRFGGRHVWAGFLIRSHTARRADGRTDRRSRSQAGRNHEGPESSVARST